MKTKDLFLSEELLISTKDFFFYKISEENKICSPMSLHINYQCVQVSNLNRNVNQFSLDIPRYLQIFLKFETRLFFLSANNYK